MDEIASGACDPESRLKLIAEAIGCSTADIHEGRGTARLMQEASELLRLFLSITSAEDRQAVLALAAQLAG